MAIPVDECTHQELTFGSGDFYVFCTACGAWWMRRGEGKPEYGTDASGKAIGAAPEESNRGVGGTLSGHRRYARG